MLASIFGTSAARFSYQGDRMEGGRTLSEFGFQIAQERSEYRYVFGDGRTQQVAMAYEGTIFIDAASSDLTRLTIRTGQLPAETGACEITQDLRYGHTQLGEGDFLLPVEAQSTIIHTDGSEAENRIQYSACHEFHGDATVHYEAPREPDGSAAAAAVAVPPLSLPPGLPFKVTFTDRIDVATAAAGDPIHGRLKTAIRDRSDKVLVPEGALVTGRIMGVRRTFASSRSSLSDRRAPRIEPNPTLVIAIRLETLDTGVGPRPFKAAFDSGVHRFVKQNGPFSVRVDIGSADELHSHPKEPDTGSLEFWENDPNHAVKTGLESNWLTAAH
jgi:hypothetical protein